MENKKFRINDSANDCNVPGSRGTKRLELLGGHFASRGAKPPSGKGLLTFNIQMVVLRERYPQKRDNNLFQKTKRLGKEGAGLERKSGQFLFSRQPPMISFKQKKMHYKAIFSKGDPTDFGQLRVVSILLRRKQNYSLRVLTTAK